MTYVVTRSRAMRAPIHQRAGHSLGLLLGLTMLGAILAGGCGDDPSSSSVPDAALLDGAPGDDAASIDAAPAIDSAPAPDADPLAPDGGAKSCGGFVGDVCDERSYCDFADNDCGNDNGLGTCQPRPEVCQPFNDPVCGCDSRQYDNQCEAYSAGTDVTPGTNCGS